MDISASLKSIDGVGDKIAVKLEKLGLFSIEDALFYFPRRYEDYTQVTEIKDLGNLNTKYQILNTQNKELFTVRGSLIGIANKKTRRRGFTVTEAVIADSTGTLKVVWFNQPFLAKMLSVGSTLLLHGKVSFDRFSHDFVMESPTRAARPMIRPIYGETAGVSSFYLEKMIGKIKSSIAEIKEFLPKSILEENNLIGIHEAFINIHSPHDSKMLEKAKRRLAFDELFLISLRANIANLEQKKEKAEPIEADIEKIKEFIGKLPFVLTDDQRKALWSILKDMGKVTPMSRLLNGDVGSGKTVVAAIAAFAAALLGQKTLVMAPTTILAGQHYETFCRLFAKSGVSVGLITSERQEMANNQDAISKNIPKTKYQKPNTKCQNKEINKSNEAIQQLSNCDILIGTHAILNQNFKNVGLVVVDEQHRFGVKQRQMLAEITNNQDSTVKNISKTKNQILNTKYQNEEINKSNLAIEQFSNNKVFPHFLSMTATPIPRTLHLALFGDLDISLIREKPANRKEIKTRFVGIQNRDKAYEFVRAQMKNGRQAFVVCPLIDGNKEQGTGNELFEEERKSVVAEFEKLKKVFPEFSVAMLHGKMKAKEKDEIMAQFVKNKINILVSTSVVEVGVDVPNASVMMIEDAERFGLAQIHQFRGRVGRGEQQSYCFLFSGTHSDPALKRLRALESTNDGFKLAEIDLETRGPGAIFGTEQSGLLGLKMASLSDRILIEEASEAAKSVAGEIEKYPLLQEKAENFVSAKHME